VKIALSDDPCYRSVIAYVQCAVRRTAQPETHAEQAAESEGGEGEATERENMAREGQPIPFAATARTREWWAAHQTNLMPCDDRPPAPSPSAQQLGLAGGVCRGGLRLERAGSSVQSPDSAGLWMWVLRPLAQVPAWLHPRAAAQAGGEGGLGTVWPRGAAGLVHSPRDDTRGALACGTRAVVRSLAALFGGVADKINSRQGLTDTPPHEWRFFF
jgi:hypothetical protein